MENHLNTLAPFDLTMGPGAKGGILFGCRKNNDKNMNYHL